MERIGKVDDSVREYFRLLCYAFVFLLLRSRSDYSCWVKKPSALLYFGLLFALVGIDVLSKSVARASGRYWANPGVILGFLGDLPPYMTVLALSALCGFLFVVFSLLVLFLSPRLHGLKLGLALLVSGVLGNVWDKALRGWTLDFIPCPWFGGTMLAFNLADVFLWAGVAVVLWFLTHREDQIWFPGNQRQLILARPKEQFVLTGQLVILIVGPAGMMALFGLAFLRQLTQGAAPEFQSETLWQYGAVCLCLGLLFVALAVLAGLWWSHRLLGPVMAFDRYVDELMSGEKRDFNLRQGDRLKLLEEISKKLKVFLGMLILCPLLGHAYPQYIGFQYTSCLTCHYNPLGNGPLNDYGRGMAATIVGGRFLVNDRTTEETLIKRAAFPGIDPTTNKWFRPTVMYRGLAVQRNAFQGKNKDSYWVYNNMQLEANVVLKGGDRDQYIASFTQGTRPNGFEDANNLYESRGYSREHYIGWRPTQKIGIYAGKMDKAFGIRVPDHNLSSRKQQRLGQYDQVHGVMLHAVGEKLEGALHAFVGDLTNRHNKVDRYQDLRDKGTSGWFEWGVVERMRLGASLMRQENTTYKNNQFAIHNRLGFGKGHSVMAEIGQNNQTVKATNKETTSRWGMLQTYLQGVRGLFILGTVDYYRADIKSDDEQVRVGPGLQWFPQNRVEFRLDIWNTRKFYKDSAPKDTFETIAQVHLWL